MTYVSMWRHVTRASSSDEHTIEPLHMHEVPNHPSEKFGTGLFVIEGRNYLVTVDYFSQFFEIYYLPETTSEAVTTKLKHHFARHGIPDKVISPQYSSQHFTTFAKEWGFTHETSSPGNSKSNGTAEAAVKIAKRLMKRYRKAKEDPYLGLVNIRNTPRHKSSSMSAWKTDKNCCCGRLQ